MSPQLWLRCCHRGRLNRRPLKGSAERMKRNSHLDSHLKRSVWKQREQTLVSLHYLAQSGDCGLKKAVMASFQLLKTCILEKACLNALLKLIPNVLHKQKKSFKLGKKSSLWKIWELRLHSLHMSLQTCDHGATDDRARRRDIEDSLIRWTLGQAGAGALSVPPTPTP